MLKIERYARGESITAYFNTSGRGKRIEIEGETLFSLNCKDNMISDNGVVVVKNIKSNQED